LKPELPGVGGGEGVGVVRETGEGVTSVRSGDWVIPAGPSLGTWRGVIVAPEKRFVKIDSNVGLNVAATLSVNPPTAYRMLKDFVSLQTGDSVIQNGGNSGVGLSVAQLAKTRGLHCISIVRDRPGLEDLVKRMKSLGAAEVVTEDFAASHRMKDLLTQYKTPKLAFNCVGGKSSTTLLKHLSDRGVMVNYGGMAKQPVTVPVGYLIFKDVKVVGYWNSKWLERNLHNPLHRSMMEDLCQLALSGHLQAPPTTHHPLADYKTALIRSMVPYVGSKQIILMNH
jgi:trans-2-enoyl-CoA reductase